MLPIPGSYAWDTLGAVYLLASAVLVHLGAGVLLYERFTRASRRFVVLTLVTAGWVAGLAGACFAADPTTAEAWLRATFVLDPFTVPAFYWVVTVLARVRRPRLEATTWLAGLAFSVTSLLTPWLVDGLQAVNQSRTLAGWGWLGAIYFVYILLVILAALYELRRSIRRAITREEWLETSLLTLAGTIACLTLVDYWTASDPFRAGVVTPIVIVVSSALVAYVSLRFRVFATSRAFGTDEVLRTISDAVLVCDSAGRVRGSNPAARRLLELPESQLTGARIDSLLLDTTRDRGWMPELGASIRDRDLTLRTAGGPLAVSISTEPLRVGGRPVGSVLVARDIRRRLQTERALHDAEVRFRSLLLHNPGLVYEFGPDGTVVDLNPAARAVLGSESRDVVGRPFSEFVVPADLPAAEEAFLAVLRGEAREYELGLRLPGRERRIRGVSIPVMDGDRVVSVLGVALDVTEAAEVRRELEVQRQYFAELFESSPEAVVLADEDGRVRRANGEFTRLFGYTLEEVEGRMLDELLVPEEQRDEARLLTEQTRKGGVVRVETVRQRKDGGRVDVSLLARDLRIGGEPPQMYAIYRDIGDRRDAERKLREREEELRHAQKLEAVGKLAGGVAHDFNNLLTVITGHARFLLDELESGSPLRTDLEEIERAGSRAASLTQQLLAFSRRQVFRPQVVDLHAVISELKRMLGRLIGEHIHLGTALEAEDPRVHTDRGQIEQVLVNLVVNARDAMPDGGAIEIRTSAVTLAADDPRVDGWQVEPGAFVQLSVTDHGVGMDAATIERAFEPFFTTKAQGKGTGLGLATVFGIVKQSGGHVTVESATGVGTSFLVLLPRAGEGGAPSPAGPEDAAGEPAVPDRVPEGETGRTILVVEDETAVRRLAVRVLERAGYRVLQARDGREALEVVAQRRGPLDLVLSDLVMPEMGGRVLAAELRTIRPDLPVVFMSGYDEEQVVQAPGIDPEMLLPKPFTPADLVGRVASLLEGSGPPEPAP